MKTNRLSHLKAPLDDREVWSAAALCRFRLLANRANHQRNWPAPFAKAAEGYRTPHASALRSRGWRGGPLFAALLLLCGTIARAAEADPYERYVRNSEDFRAVKQDKDWALKAFPSWTYMPWTHQWTLGYTDEAGRWSQAHGYNGAFVDRDAIAAEGSQTGRLDWINQFGLHFYVDHAAD